MKTATKTTADPTAIPARLPRAHPGKPAAAGLGKPRVASCGKYRATDRYVTLKRSR